MMQNQQQPTTPLAILFPSQEIAPQSARFPTSEERSERQRKCAWCWEEREEAKAEGEEKDPYPNEWSSTICERHEAGMLAESARRRQMAQRIARKPTYLFWLIFPGGELVTLQVFNANSQEQAMTEAEHAFNCRYHVLEGQPFFPGQVPVRFRLTVASEPVKGRLQV